MNREPALAIGALVGLADAIVAGLAYSQDWTADATALILGIVTAAASVISALFVRSRVTPVD